MGYAVLFPGQGSQAVGMGADVFAARPDLLGNTADEVLGRSLESLCLEGPDEELTRTENAQPALYAIAFALWAELSEALDRPPVASAGHSLGEYTALAASGAMSFVDGLRLVAARGAAMAEAADAQPSGMAALIGADEEAAESLAETRRQEGGRLWVANINAPGQVVIAGGSEDIEWATANARAHGVRRAIPLKVAGAFHSPFMVAAADQLALAVDGTNIGAGSFPVWANVTAAAHGDAPGAVLVEQLTSPVRFSESLRSMSSFGVDVFVHVGPGDVTAGLAARSVEGADTIVVSSLADIAAAAERLNTDH